MFESPINPMITGMTGQNLSEFSGSTPMLNIRITNPTKILVNGINNGLLYPQLSHIDPPLNRQYYFNYNRTY